MISITFKLQRHYFLDYPQDILNSADPGSNNWRFHVPNNENISFVDG